ncbi:pyridoxal phosphate-dependent aminotransferase [Pendulispora albinea]|uniref:Aminotransferase n=1 Tax=Pendulispora albinea TaxID=2741071 RepID=A0ABZ2M0U3_9BACT
MDDRIASPLAAAAPQHGGLLDDELVALGLSADQILDVSVNVNPYGPCPTMRRAIAEAAIERYPDPTSSRARQAIAALSGVPRERVVLGNGAVDLLWTLARAWLRPGDAAMIVEPAFSELGRAATQMGARIASHRVSPHDDFALHLGALDAHLRSVRPRLLYLCTPSNPAGVCVPLQGIEELAERHPDTLIVCDLSFLSLSRDHDTIPRSPRVAWIVSLTKDHALAGLRVGYAIAPAPVAARLESERPPWSVNALAQAAAIAATEPEARRFVDESRERLLRDRASLEHALRRLDLRFHPSETIFVLVDLGPARKAGELRRRLLERHAVLVRDATSFGLPHHVRLAARPEADVERLFLALNRELYL